MPFPRLACCLTILCATARAAFGVILLGTGDPLVNTTSPGDDSGWQYEGQFNGFLGTPIAPFYFITANHIGGNVGDSFVFYGQTFITLAIYPDPASDLRIWKVDHAFPTWAPLYLNIAGGASEVGRELRVFGRGTQRGDPMTLDGTLRGWAWGPGDGIQRWGSNVVTAVVPYGGSELLQVSFDSPGLGFNEAHLSDHDSGGAVFVQEGGLWKLAAINYAVDDLYTAPNGTHFTAAIFDARGYYTKDDAGNFMLISGSAPVPTSFYSTRIASRLAWIQSVAGPNADPDGDGTPNLLEFAFNLDPTVAGPMVMTADTGVRGLPLIRLETIAATNDTRLTVEFVRLTAESGSGLTYAVQFASDLGSANAWQTGGVEAVTPIDARWERVKVTDSVSASGASGVVPRFARVVVTQAP